MEIQDKIGYTRVSTRDQDPENQIRLLSECGIPSDYIFIDRGISGTVPAEQRIGFKRALDYILSHPGEIKYLYVFELSRLGRNFVETVHLIDKLETSGVMVWSISPTESFLRMHDKSIRQLLISLMLWVAQRERENLVERTKAGIDRARAEGKQIGRKRVDIDWSTVENMRISGESWQNIADELHIPVLTLFRARDRRGMVGSKQNR